MKLYVTTTEDLTNIANAIRSIYYINNLLLYPNDFISSLKDNIEMTPTTRDFILGRMSLIISNTTIKKILPCAFYFNKILTIELLSCSEIGQEAFVGCNQLVNLSFPICQKINETAFANCSSLISINFPECQIISDWAFKNCINLLYASFPKCERIAGMLTFISCYNLTSIYLLNSVMTSLDFMATYIFSSTPITDYTTSTSGIFGSIYVPASLLTTYKTDHYWSYISDRIVAYESN